MGTVARAGAVSSPRTLTKTNRTAHENHRKTDRTRLIALIATTALLFHSAGKSNKDNAIVEPEFSSVYRSRRRRYRHLHRSEQRRERIGSSRRLRMRRGDRNDSMEVQWERNRHRAGRSRRDNRAVQTRPSRARHRRRRTIRVLCWEGRKPRKNSRRLQ